MAEHGYNKGLISAVYADLELLTINTSRAAGRNSAGNLSPNSLLHCFCLYQSIKEGQARKNKTMTRVEDVQDRWKGRSGKHGWENRKIKQNEPTFRVEPFYRWHAVCRNVRGQVGNVALNLKRKSSIWWYFSMFHSDKQVIFSRLFLFLLPGQNLQQGQAYKREGALLVDSSEWKGR